MKVSIITPVYNVSDFIDECILSVLNQTYQNFELILIDDRSTDDSGLIIKNYSIKDARIITSYNKKNIGVAQTRNKGIKLATGDYFYFLDSDDFLTPDALSLMVKQVASNPVDILLVDVFKHFPNGSLEYYQNLFREREINDFTGHAAWWALIKKEVITTNKNIRFVSDAHPGEDTVFMFKVFSNAKTYARLKEPVLNYRQHSDSVMAKMKTNKCKLTHSSILCLIDLEEFEKEISTDRMGAYNKLRNFFLRSISLRHLDVHDDFNKSLFKKIIAANITRFIFYKKITKNSRLLVKVCKIPVCNIRLKT